MTLKPPTRTFPKLVMKEWPERDDKTILQRQQEAWSRSLSDFTRVVEETGILKKP